MALTTLLLPPLPLSRRGARLCALSLSPLPVLRELSLSPLPVLGEGEGEGAIFTSPRGRGRRSPSNARQPAGEGRSSLDSP
jgi:hypothetical protein